MVMEVRGGEPSIQRLTGLGTGVTEVRTVYKTNAAGGQYFGISKYLQVANAGTNALRIFFSLADATANVNYITLAANATEVFGATNGTFFEGPVEANTLYLRAAAGTTNAVVVSYQRRG